MSSTTIAGHTESETASKMSKTVTLTEEQIVVLIEASNLLASTLRKEQREATDDEERDGIRNDIYTNWAAFHALRNAR